jgi:putative spermidine/putrescine transport system substrate-binding protein
MEDRMSQTASAVSISRRGVLAGTAAGLGSFVAGRTASAADRQIVYASWGGSWQAALKKAWFDPFTAETGIGISVVGGNEYGRIEAMVRSGHTEWDVVEVLPDFQWIGPARGLVEPIDWNPAERSSILDAPNLVTDFSVPQVLFSRVMTYNTTKFANAPQTWADFFDLKRFPGMRTFYAKASGGALEAALLADGVAPDKLYPLDVPRALAKLGTIRESIQFYQTNAQSEQYMMDGQAVLGLIADGRALSIRNAGAKIDIVFPVSLISWSSMVIPKGAPHPELAQQFLAYTLTPKAQAAIAMAYTYGPVVPAAYALFPKERAAILSGGPSSQGLGIMTDEAWWGKNLAPVSEKMNTWMLG